MTEQNKQTSIIAERILESPIVAAALELAMQAHEGEWRDRKGSKKVPYIYHPLLVAELLGKLGRADDLSLAVALLHDAPEDYWKYRKEPSLFNTDLIKKLEECGLTQKDAALIGNKIAGYCFELKNGEEMPEGKRVYQVEHVRMMSPRARLIKVLDQAATVIDDVRYESRRSPEQLETFALKGLNLAKTATSTGDNAVKLAYHLYKDIFIYFKNQSQMEPEAMAASRIAYSIDQSIDNAVSEFLDTERYSSLEDAYDERWRHGEDGHWAQDTKHTKHVMHPVLKTGSSKGQPETGCVSIEFTEAEKGKFKVAGFAMLVPEDDSPSVTASEAMLGAIESFDRRQRVTIKDSGIIGNRLVRDFKVKPAMSMDEFRSATLKADATVRRLTGREKPAPILDKRFQLEIGKALKASIGRNPEGRS